MIYSATQCGHGLEYPLCNCKRSTDHTGSNQGGRRPLTSYWQQFCSDVLCAPKSLVLRFSHHPKQVQGLAPVNVASRATRPARSVDQSTASKRRAICYSSQTPINEMPTRTSITSMFHTTNRRALGYLASTLLGSCLAASAWAQDAESSAREFIITGAGPDLEANIRAHVSLPELACDAGGYILARNLPGIRQDIVRAGRALGYYQIQHVTRFERVEQCWQLQSDIDPGVPVRINNINIEVASDQQFFRSALSELPIAQGDQLNQASYERVKTELSSVAVEQGFFDARYERSQLQLDLVENIANVDINFEPGPRYRLGNISIQELDALSPEFISRFLEIEEGDYYSSSALLELRDSLNGSMYFNNVSVTPLITQAQNQAIPVDVTLQMRPQRVYAVGLGATTDIGPRVRLDYEDRYRNRQGHSITGNIGISPVQQNADIAYRIPMSEPATESLEISAGFLAEDTDTFRNTTSKLGTTYSFINAWNWRQNYFVNIQHDESRITGEKLVTDLIIPGVSLNRTRADDALIPTRGWRLYGEMKGASDALLSSESFMQFNLSGKLIRTLGPARFLWRFDTGTTVIDEVSELPVSLRYFSGGDQSIRGYKYESLGPVNEDNEVVGGKHRLSTSIEMDFFVAENWKLAVFADTGNSFDEFDDFELKTGVGVGVRWLSPVGPIRVDVASALDNDNKLRLHITMGPDL